MRPPSPAPSPSSAHATLSTYPQLAWALSWKYSPNRPPGTLSLSLSFLLSPILSLPLPFFGFLSLSLSLAPLSLFRFFFLLLFFLPSHNFLLPYVVSLTPLLAIATLCCFLLPPYCIGSHSFHHSIYSLPFFLSPTPSLSLSPSHFSLRQQCFFTSLHHTKVPESKINARWLFFYGSTCIY